MSPRSAKLAVWQSKKWDSATPDNFFVKSSVNCFCYSHIADSNDDRMFSLFYRHQVSDFIRNLADSTCGICDEFQRRLIPFSSDQHITDM